MSNERTRPDIIYNVAGWMGKSVLPHSMIGMGKMLQDAGFDGISALPLKQEELLLLYKSFPPIILVEDAWNPGNFDNIALAGIQGVWGELKRRVMKDQSEPSTLPDTMFFAGRKTSLSKVNRLMESNPQAMYGSIGFDKGFDHLDPKQRDRLVAETNRFPGRTHVHIQRDYKPYNLSADEIIDLAQQENKLLLFDPLHLSNLDRSTVSAPNSPTKESAFKWQKHLDKFAPFVAGIDIHAASQEEIEELIAETGSLYELVKAGMEVYDKYKKSDFLRVEATMPLRFQYPIKDYEKSAVEYLQTIVATLKKVRDSKY